jgi:CMP-N-acetylneuraminic acid synthetase
MLHVRRSRTLAVIPARAGSKRLPGKNRERVGDASLVETAIQHARASGVCDEIVVSTDDAIVARQAARARVRTVRRPRALATSTATTIAVARHAVEAMERETGAPFSSVVILQPTSPLRTAADIRAAMRAHERAGRRSVVSVTLARHWSWGLQLGRGGAVRRIVRPTARRPLERASVYLPNGAVYVIARERVDDRWAEGAIAHVMPRERSVDVDDAVDLAIARALYRR